MLLDYISHDGTTQSIFVFCATIIIVLCLVHRWMIQQDNGQEPPNRFRS